MRKCGSLRARQLGKRPWLRLRVQLRLRFFVWPLVASLCLASPPSSQWWLAFAQTVALVGDPGEVGNACRERGRR